MTILKIIVFINLDPNDGWFNTNSGDQVICKIPSGDFNTII